MRVMVAMLMMIMMRTVLLHGVHDAPRSVKPIQGPFTWSPDRRNAPVRNDAGTCCCIRFTPCLMYRMYREEVSNLLAAPRLVKLILR
jgi:hypothetical protein